MKGGNSLEDRNEKLFMESEAKDFIDENIKEASIQQILDAGLEQKFSFLGTLWKEYCRLGWRMLMYGAWDYTLMAIAVMGLLDYLMIRMSPVQEDELFFILLPAFLMAPAFYGIQNLLGIWKEVIFGTYEMRSVCRISLRQLTTMRSMVWGMAAAIFIFISDIVLYACLDIELYEISFRRLLEVSYTGLFLYGAIQTLIPERIHGPYHSVVAGGIWMLLVLTGFAVEQTAEQVFMIIPDIGYVIMCAALLCAICLGVKKEYLGNRENAIPNRWRMTQNI